MIDYKKISSITASYIFYKDSTSEKVNADKLESIIDIIRNEVVYYNRMYDEMKHFLEIKREELEIMQCPTKEDIQIRDINKSYDLQCKRNEYFKSAYKCSGISDLFTDTLHKMHHYENLYRQITAVYNNIKKRKTA